MVDASALVALVEPVTFETVAAALVPHAELHAPHLVDAEVGQALRGLVLGGRVAADDARRRLDDALRLVTSRHEDEALRGLAWGLRDRVSFYDAQYVALAALLDVPLLTADVRLGRAGPLPCEVEVLELA